jgi:striatin 1/3/4
MRFLQMEWHNHERARNVWSIEREEMKIRIAKQEGELRHAKRMYEQMDRKVRMLELAIANERKNKANSANGTPAEAKLADTEGQNDLRSSSKAAAKKDDSKSVDRPNNRTLIHHTTPLRWQEYADQPTEPHNSFLETAGTKNVTGNPEDHIDKTSKYLKDCMAEITYLLQQPPTGPVDASNGYAGQPGQQLGVPEEMLWPRQSQRVPRQPATYASQLPPTHLPPPLPNSLPQSSAQLEEQRSGRYPEYSSLPQASIDNLQQNTQHVPAPYDEPAETITHTFDNRGRPIEPEPQLPQRTERGQAEPDGWTFDEEVLPSTDGYATEVPTTRRPDTDLFPSAAGSTQLPAKSPPRNGPQAHRRKNSGSQSMARRRSSQGKSEAYDSADTASGGDPSQFKVKFALRGHLDVVRSVVFSGGGSPSEPEVCTASDDGTVKRWIVPATYQNYNIGNNNSDLDIQAYFTHRGHEGIVTCLATCPASTGFSTGGRANGDGWIFSGGQDATVRVWERGRVDPKATLEGHTDAVWAVCVLPASVGVVFGQLSGNFGGPDRLLLVSGSADGTVKVWAVSAPPQTSSPATGSRRGVGGSRRHSVTSGSNFPSSPQPSVASTTPFGYTLIHSIERPANQGASPTSICALSPSGETFVVSYTDSSALVYDTRSGEEIVGMASNETYDGTMATSINAVVATSTNLEGTGHNGIDSDEVGGGATGGRDGVEGVIITGHEDRFVRFFDAHSGKYTACSQLNASHTIR